MPPAWRWLPQAPAPSCCPQDGRPQALPHAGHPRHRAVRAVEARAVQELRARPPGGPGGAHPGHGAALGARVPHPGGCSSRAAPSSLSAGCFCRRRRRRHGCCSEPLPGPSSVPALKLRPSRPGPPPAARHPHAAGHQRRGEGQPARAGAGAHGAPGPALQVRACTVLLALSCLACQPRAALISAPAPFPRPLSRQGCAHAGGGHPGHTPRGAAGRGRAGAPRLRRQQGLGDVPGVRGPAPGGRREAPGGVLLCRPASGLAISIQHPARSPQPHHALCAARAPQDILIGLLRLRKISGPDSSRQPELQGRCSVVRELHVYGTAVAVHARNVAKFQHQVGLGPFAATCALLARR